MDFEPEHIHIIPSHRRRKVIMDLIIPSLVIVGAVILPFLVSNTLIAFIFIAVPAIFICSIQIQHYFNYFARIKLREAKNRHIDQNIHLNFNDGTSTIVSADTVRTVFNYCVSRKWNLPWSSYEYLKIVLKDDQEIFINSLECDVVIISLLLTHYQIPVIEIEYFTNLIQGTTSNRQLYTMPHTRRS